MPAPCCADVHGLANAKGPVADRVALVQDALLHPHRPDAGRTGARFLAGGHQGPRDAADLLLAALLEISGALPKLLEGVQGSAAVFFPGSSPKWA